MNIRMLGVVALGALAVAGCQKKNCENGACGDAAAKAPAIDPEQVLLDVNGHQLKAGELYGDIDKLIAAQKIPAERVEDAREYFKGQMAQAFLMKTLLLGEADKAGIKIDDADRKNREEEFVKSVAKMENAPKSVAEYAEKSPLGKERALREFEEGIKIDKFLNEVVFKDVKADPAEVDKIIANVVSNNAEIVKNAEGAEGKIKDLLKQLEGGADFAELAKANSDCPSASKGGELGEFGRGQMVKEFEDAAFGAEVGKVVGPVKTQFGWHLIKVTKKIPAVEAKDDKPASPEKVEASHILVKVAQPQPVPAKEQVENYLVNNLKQQAFRAFIEKARASAKISAPGFPEMNPPPAPKAPAEATVPAAEAKAPAEADAKAAEAPAAK